MIAPMLGRNDRDQEGVGVPRLFAGNRGGAVRHQAGSCRRQRGRSVLKTIF
jgi:hypothetical protein